MSNPLEKLTLDHWYKVLMAVGFSVFLLLASGLLPRLPVEAGLLISLGTFFFGLGEWINHPLQQRIIPGVGIGSSYPRSPTSAGIAIDVLALVLVAFGLVKLL